MGALTKTWSVSLYKKGMLYTRNTFAVELNVSLRGGEALVVEHDNVLWCTKNLLQYTHV